MEKKVKGEVMMQNEKKIAFLLYYLIM